MTEREATKDHPKCPECGGQAAAALAGTPTHQRYQCANAKCLNTYAIQIRDLPQPDSEAAQKEESVANDLDCPKCGKEYQRGGLRREKHVKSCKGAESPAPRRAPQGRQPKPAEPETEPIVIVPSQGEQLPLAQRVIGFLEVEEERLTKELGQCKAMIAAVRESADDAQGGG